jgi:hypothetical protein
MGPLWSRHALWDFHASILKYLKYHPKPTVFTSQGCRIAGMPQLVSENR